MAYTLKSQTSFVGPPMNIIEPPATYPTAGGSIIFMGDPKEEVWDAAWNLVA